MNITEVAMLGYATTTIEMAGAAVESRRVAYALEARALTLVRGRKTVLADFDLAIRAGEMIALTGANGSGKTTLMHGLAGALTPMRGEILWYGESARSHVRRRQIGFLGHETGLYLELTARENLLLAGRMYGLDDPAERAARWLNDADLQRLQHQPARCLSRGMRQRLAIARAAIHDPSILLLDEPFTSLDAGGCRWLWEILACRRAGGCAILVAGHDLDETGFDRVIVLAEGR